MKRITSFLLTLLLYSSILPAQTTAPNLQSDIPKVTPPSPNATALGKFGELPVNLSTGIPSIGQGLFSWSGGELSLSVSLSYHAGGHKVEDMASDVGLGWALNGLGRVSRTVRSLPDDDYLAGYLYTPNLPLAATTNYSASGDGEQNGFVYWRHNNALNASEGITAENSPHYTLLQEISNGTRDGEPDVFNFSMGGRSGKFLIQKNGTILLLEHGLYKISYTTHPTNAPLMEQRGKIKDFRITDDNGIVYWFEETETQRSDPIAYGSTTLNAPPINVYASSWLLTRIVSADGYDTIRLHYTTQSSKYESGFSQSRQYTLLNPFPPQVPSGMINQAAQFWAGTIYNSDYNLAEGEQATSASLITQQGKKISRIAFPDGSEARFIYQTPRLDLVGDTALDRVLLLNPDQKTVKNTRLLYGYFTTAAEAPLANYYASGNDFTKRLQLTGIREEATDTALAFNTLFSYNTLPLNRRDSRNLDYWGYTVNPARNNNEYLPRLRLKDNDLPLNPNGGFYMGTANRNPDSVFSRAGILERISYPTGGFTQLDYENNRAFGGTMPYFENRDTTSVVSFLPGQWGIIKSLVFTNRADTGVDVYCKANEAGPRGATPPTCLEGQQDSRPAQFVITSTDGTVTVTIASSYGNFAAGFWKKINLPLGKTYAVRFDFSYTTTCEYLYPFTATIQGQYTIPPQDKLAGGLRIKQMTSNDGMGNTIVKTYSYALPDGHSSAKLYRIPNFDYQKSTQTQVIANGSGFMTYYSRYFRRSSSPNQSMEYLNGAPLIYTRVTEQQSGAGHTERQYDDTEGAYFLGQGDYPYLPAPDLGFLGNLLTREMVRSQTGSLSLDKTIVYNKVLQPQSNPALLSLKPGAVGSAPGGAPVFVVNGYYPITGRAEQTGSTSQQYEAGRILNSSENKWYDSTYYNLRCALSVNSDGDSSLLELFYPYNYVADANMQQLMAQNRLATPVKWLKWQPNGGATRLLEGSALTYFGGLPSVNYRLSTEVAVSRNSFDNTLNGRLLVSSLDEADVSERVYEQNRLVQYRTRQGNYNSILYDYPGKVITAQATRARTDEVAATSFESTGKGNWSFSGVPATATAVTGKKVYTLSPATAIGKTGLNPAKTYTVSLWATTAGVTVNGTGPVKTGAALNGFTQYTYSVSGTGSVIISGSAVIDELRLHPKGAEMVSFTYEPLVGITSQCSPQHEIQYYQYDALNRLLRITDARGRVLKTICYSYTGQVQPCQ
jgi:YD repeat-containing protein